MSQNEPANAFLGTEKIGVLMRKYSIPCIISLLVAALYNIVDQIFIANAAYLGSYGNAANTVVYPLTIVALAIAVLIGDGCCAYVSISMGAKENERAHRSMGNSIILVVGASIIVTLVYFIFQEPIIAAFGGKVNEDTFYYAKEYFTFITMGIPFYMFGQAMNPIIRSDGSPKFAMASTVSGAVINIILDPIFIYILKWGMMGAALATVIGQVVTAVLAIWYMMHTKTVRLQKSSFRLEGRIVKRMLPLGGSSFLAQISLVASMATVNNMVRTYGALDPVFGLEEYAQIPMAVLGIVMKFFQIIISIVIGMAAGCIPVVGFNIGAGRNDRARELFRRLLTYEAIVGIVSFLIVELLPKQLIQIFGAANESAYYTQYAVKCFRIYLSMVILACLNKATFIFLQSLGKAFLSTILSLIREIVFGVGFALILPLFFGLNGVLYSMPVSDICTFIICLFVIRYTYRQLSDIPQKGR